MEKNIDAKAHRAVTLNIFGACRAMFAAASCVVLAVIAAAVGQAQTVLTVPTLPPAMPEHSLAVPGVHKAPVMVETSNPDIVGAASYSTKHQSVTIEWTYKVVGLSTGRVWGDSSLANCLQEIKLDFWPTEVACVGADRLLVAGVSIDDFVVVKEISLADTSLPSVYFSPSGEQVPPAISVAVAAMRLVFRAQHSGAEYVAAIFRNWADEERPFLVLVVSQCIIQLDLTTLGWSLAASIGGGATSLAVPELDKLTPRNGYVSVGAARVASDSSCHYWLSAREPDGLPALVLSDSDADGQLDTYQMVSSSAWGALAVSDGTQIDAYR